MSVIQSVLKHRLECGVVLYGVVIYWTGVSWRKVEQRMISTSYQPQSGLY